MQKRLIAAVVALMLCPIFSGIGIQAAEEREYLKTEDFDLCDIVRSPGDSFGANIASQNSTWQLLDSRGGAGKYYGFDLEDRPGGGHYLTFTMTKGANKETANSPYWMTTVNDKTGTTNPANPIKDGIVFADFDFCFAEGENTTSTSFILSDSTLANKRYDGFLIWLELIHTDGEETFSAAVKTSSQLTVLTTKSMAYTTDWMRIRLGVDLDTHSLLVYCGNALLYQGSYTPSANDNVAGFMMFSSRGDRQGTVCVDNLEIFRPSEADIEALNESKNMIIEENFDDCTVEKANGATYGANIKSETSSWTLTDDKRGYGTYYGFEKGEKSQEDCFVRFTMTEGANRTNSDEPYWYTSFSPVTEGIVKTSIRFRFAPGQNTTETTFALCDSTKKSGRYADAGQMILLTLSHTEGESTYTCRITHHGIANAQTLYSAEYPYTNAWIQLSMAVDLDAKKTFAEIGGENIWNGAYTPSQSDNAAAFQLRFARGQKAGSVELDDLSVRIVKAAEVYRTYQKTYTDGLLLSEPVYDGTYLTLYYRNFTGGEITARLMAAGYDGNILSDFAVTSCTLHEAQGTVRLRCSGGAPQKAICLFGGNNLRPLARKLYAKA